VTCHRHPSCTADLARGVFAREVLGKRGIKSQCRVEGLDGIHKGERREGRPPQGSVEKKKKILEQGKGSTLRRERRDAKGGALQGKRGGVGAKTTYRVGLGGKKLSDSGVLCNWEGLSSRLGRAAPWEKQGFGKANLRVLIEGLGGVGATPANSFLIKRGGGRVR